MLHKFLWKEQEIVLESRQSENSANPICTLLGDENYTEYAAFDVQSSKELVAAQAGRRKKSIPFLYTEKGIYLHYEGRSLFFAFRRLEGDEKRQDEEYRSNMPGKVLRIYVEKGDLVEAGQCLLVLEAMKMENQICAKASGRITQIFVKESALVGADEPLLRMDYSRKQD